jgi:hypothetical protein
MYKAPNEKEKGDTQNGKKKEKAIKENHSNEIGKNFAIKLYHQVDKLKIQHRNALNVKNNWKKKYFELEDEFKELKEMYEFTRHLP